MALEHAGASFIQDLSFTDLKRLRLIVKRVYMRYHPNELCTDAEADRIIEAMGPRVHEKMLKRAIDAGKV